MACKMSFSEQSKGLHENKKILGQGGMVCDEPVEPGENAAQPPEQRDEQARSEAKARWLDQIRSALQSEDYGRASSLIASAEAEFPNDEEILEVKRKSSQAAENVAEAKKLLALGQSLCAQQLYDEGVAQVRRARELAPKNPAIRGALLDMLVERARILIDTDLPAAEPLIQEALEIDPAHALAKSLRTRVLDHKRDQAVIRCFTQARQLRAAGELDKALAETEQCLAIYPLDPRLVQLREILSKELERSRVKKTGGADLAEPQQPEQDSAPAPSSTAEMERPPEAAPEASAVETTATTGETTVTTPPPPQPEPPPPAAASVAEPPAAPSPDAAAVPETPAPSPDAAAVPETPAPSPAAAPVAETPAPASSPTGELPAGAAPAASATPEAATPAPPQPEPASSPAASVAEPPAAPSPDAAAVPETPTPSPDAAAVPETPAPSPAAAPSAETPAPAFSPTGELPTGTPPAVSATPEATLPVPPQPEPASPSAASVAAPSAAPPPDAAALPETPEPSPAAAPVAETPAPASSPTGELPAGAPPAASAPSEPTLPSATAPVPEPSSQQPETAPSAAAAPSSTEAPEPLPEPKLEVAVNQSAKWAIVSGAAAFAAVLLTILTFTALHPSGDDRITFEVRTQPPGALVRVDGKIVGTSNLPLTVSPGTYQLEATLDGYLPASKSIAVSESAGPVELVLEPAPQTVRLFTDAAEGTVTLDDQPPRDLLDGQLSLDSVAPGTHTLRIAARNSEAVITFELVPNGVPHITSPPAVKNVAALVVGSFGNRARIYSSIAPAKAEMDGQPAGEVLAEGLELSGLAPGPHELSVSNGGTRIRKVIETGQAPVLTVFLEADRNIGTLLIVAGEEGADVYLDGVRYPRQTGPGGLLRIQRTPRQYRVRVAKPGFQETAEQTVQVVKGSERRVVFKLVPLPTSAPLVIHGAPPGTTR